MFNVDSPWTTGLATGLYCLSVLLILMGSCKRFFVYENIIKLKCSIPGNQQSL